MISPHKFLSHLDGLTGCFVAGGAVTSTYTNKPVADIDLYPKNWAAMEEAIRWAFDNSLWCVFASSRAMTFASRIPDAPNIQIMTFDEFPSASFIFEAFDFTCCMGAYDLDEKAFILHDQFMVHCAQRFLSFNPNTRFPYASAWRVRKYEEKGFTIGKMEFQKILMACAEKPIRSWDDLKEQIGGVYGEAFDIPADEPFSTEAAHRAMATLRPVKPGSAFESADEAIMLMSPIERDYFETKDESGTSAYWVMLDGEFTRMSAPPRVGRLVPAFNGGRLYKKVVRQPDGSFRSNYRPEFAYRIGDEVSSAEPFIWVVASPEAARNYNIWSGNKDWAIIEIKADPEDIICNGSELKIRKGVVVCEHPIEAEAIAA